MALSDTIQGELIISCVGVQVVREIQVDLSFMSPLKMKSCVCLDQTG